MLKSRVISATREVSIRWERESEWKLIGEVCLIRASGKGELGGWSGLAWLSRPGSSVSHGEHNAFRGYAQLSMVRA